VCQVWERPYFHASRSLSQSLDAALKITELRTDDIDLFDFYSYASLVYHASMQSAY
jgi:hypothetical protein